MRHPEHLDQTLGDSPRSKNGGSRLSQSELADRMGTSHSAISRIEGGQHATTVETLRRLADALETHLVVGFADITHGDPEQGEPLSVHPAEAELVAVG